MVQKDADAKNAAADVADRQRADVVAANQAAAANDPYDQHKRELRAHQQDKKSRYDAAAAVVAPSKFNKVTEIDTRGMDVIEAADLAEYCESLADLIDETDPKGLKGKLVAEVQAQRGNFKVGGLQPLMKTQAVAVESMGAFSIVQLASAWKGDTIAIHYIQKGIAWTMMPGEASPNIDQMTVFHQYRAVEALIDEMGPVGVIKPLPPPGPPRVKVEKREKFGLQ